MLLSMWLFDHKIIIDNKEKSVFNSYIILKL